MSTTPSKRRSKNIIVPQKTAGARPGAEEWEVPVWQFVRIMDQLERNSSGSSTSLWKANADSWHELDQALTDAGEEDFDVFSQLMMNTQVALHLPDGIAKRTLAFTLNSLLVKMKRRTEGMAKRSDERKDLDFEISELGKLHTRVKPSDDAAARAKKAYQPKRFGAQSGRAGAGGSAPRGGRGQR